MKCPRLAKEYNVITPKNVNAILPSSYRRTPGTRVTLSCLVPSAFKLIGHNVLTCLQNGQWNHPIPKCVNKTKQIVDLTTITPESKQAAIHDGDRLQQPLSSLSTPYIITVCVLAVMFLCLVIMMTYLIRMRKSIDRKIESLDRRPAYVKAVESLRSIPSLSSGAYDYFRRPHSPISASSSHSSSNDGRLRQEEAERGHQIMYSERWSPG